MERKGTTLKTVPDGHPRRMSDGKNAYRKMNSAQRWEFLDWVFNADEPHWDDSNNWECFRNEGCD